MQAMRTRVLGIDIGLKRTGLAVSDELGVSVRPLPNRAPQSRAQDVEFLLALCAELSVGIIVIGYPEMPRSGTEGPIGRRARGLKWALEEAIKDAKAHIIVTLIDESYTSKNAVSRLIDSGVKQSKRLSMLDSEVARMLVEEYLATREAKSHD